MRGSHREKKVDIIFFLGVLTNRRQDPVLFMLEWENATERHEKEEQLHAR